MTSRGKTVATDVHGSPSTRHFQPHPNHHKKQRHFDIETITEVLTSKNYKLLEPVGTGNHSQVFKIKSNEDHKQYAVKVIDMESSPKEHQLRFIPREIDVLSRVRHKNIVDVYEIYRYTRFVFIFMDYAPNGTLAEFLKLYKEMPEWMCKPIVKQLFSAVEYLHEIDVAHRNIKLENILLDKRKNPLLTDFSYALTCEHESGKTSLSRTFCGSLPYVPPEIIRETPYDPKMADIWSLGVCLFVMLNNSLPFKPDSPVVMLQFMTNKEFRFKSEVDKEVSDLAKDCIRKMLEPDVRFRITAKKLVKHPWVSGP